MSSLQRLDACLRSIHVAIEKLRQENVVQCKGECKQLLKLLEHERNCGREVLKSLRNGGDALTSNLDDFEQSLDDLCQVAEQALPIFQKCCGADSNFWRTVSSPSQELLKLAEKLCCTPLDPVQAATEILESGDIRPFLNPSTAQLVAVNHPQTPPTLWISNHHNLMCHYRRGSNKRKTTFAWPEGAAVTATAVSSVTGCVWTGHQNGAIAVHGACGKRSNPTPVGQPPLSAPIVAIALYESKDSCHAWVADSAGNLLILKRERAPGVPADKEAYLLHPVGKVALKAPVTALLVHKGQVLLATAGVTGSGGGGQPPLLRLLPASRPDNGRNQMSQLEESHSVPVPEPIKHIVVLPEYQRSNLDMFHVITASGSHAAGGLSVWCIPKRHSFHLVARVCPPLPSPGGLLPPVCGIHISADARLLVTVHNDDTPLRIWALAPILGLMNGPPLAARPPPGHTDHPPVLQDRVKSIKIKSRDYVLTSVSDADRVVVARSLGVVRAWDWDWLMCYAEVHEVLDRLVEAPTGHGLLSSIPSITAPETPPRGGSEEGGGGGGAAAAGAEAAVPLVRREELSFLKDGLLGSGSFGEVCLAKYKNDKVAVKVLLEKNMEGRTPQQVEELMRALVREVQHLSRAVYYPRFVRMVGWCPQPPMIITEYYELGSLDKQLATVRKAIRQGRPLPDILPTHHIARWDVRLRIAQGIAAGMHSAHERQPEPLIHGDLRSPNIMLAQVDSSLKAYIGDLGQALLLGGESRHHTTNPRWMAPELLQQGNEPSTKSDVWAMGVILWELLTCDIPYHDLGDDVQVLVQVINGQARPLAAPPLEQLPHFGRVEYDGLDDYINLMHACMHPDPAQRPEFSRIAAELGNIINQPKFKRVARVLLEWFRKRSIVDKLRPTSSQPSQTSSTPHGASTSMVPSTSSEDPNLSNSPDVSPPASPRADAPLHHLPTPHPPTSNALGLVHSPVVHFDQQPSPPDAAADIQSPLFSMPGPSASNGGPYTYRASDTPTPPHGALSPTPPGQPTQRSTPTSSAPSSIRAVPAATPPRLDLPSPLGVCRPPTSTPTASDASPPHPAPPTLYPYQTTPNFSEEITSPLFPPSASAAQPPTPAAPTATPPRPQSSSLPPSTAPGPQPSSPHPSTALDPGPPSPAAPSTQPRHPDSPWDLLPAPAPARRATHATFSRMVSLNQVLANDPQLLSSRQHKGRNPGSTRAAGWGSSTSALEPSRDQGPNMATGGQALATLVPGPATPLPRQQPLTGATLVTAPPPHTRSPHSSLPPPDAHTLLYPPANLGLSASLPYQTHPPAGHSHQQATPSSSRTDSHSQSHLTAWDHPTPPSYYNPRESAPSGRQWSLGSQSSTSHDRESQDRRLPQDRNPMFQPYTRPPPASSGTTPLPVVYNPLAPPTYPAPPRPDLNPTDATAFSQPIGSAPGSGGSGSGGLWMGASQGRSRQAPSSYSATHTGSSSVSQASLASWTSSLQASSGHQGTLNGTSILGAVNSRGSSSLSQAARYQGSHTGTPHGPNAPAWTPLVATQSAPLDTNHPHPQRAADGRQAPTPTYLTHRPAPATGRAQAAAAPPASAATASLHPPPHAVPHGSQRYPLESPFNNTPHHLAHWQPPHLNS